jgi:hypothetical protein
MPEQLHLFRSPEFEARFDTAYQAVLNQWPVSYEELSAVHRPLLVAETGRPILQRTARIMLLVAVSLALAIPLAYLSVYLAYADWVLGVSVAAWLGGRRFACSRATGTPPEPRGD